MRTRPVSSSRGGLFSSFSPVPPEHEVLFVVRRRRAVRHTKNAGSTFEILSCSSVGTTTKTHFVSNGLNIKLPKTSSKHMVVLYRIGESVTVPTPVHYQWVMFVLLCVFSYRHRPSFGVGEGGVEFGF